MTKSTGTSARLITRDTALIMAATFFFMSASVLGSPIIAGFADTLGASGTFAGFIVGLLSLTAFFCRPFVGRLADRSSKRRMALIGSGLYLISNAWYAFCSNSGLLLCARIVNGIGFAFISVCLSAWLAMLLPVERMGAGMGIYGTMNALAQAVGPDLGIRIMQSFGYRSAFLTAAALSALVIVFVLLIRDGGQPIVKPAGEAPAKRQSRAMLLPSVIPVALIFTMFGIPYFANQSFIVDIASARHLPFGVSIFFPIYALVLLGLRILLRNWFDTKSFTFWLIVCTVSGAGMITCLTVMNSVWILAAGAMCTAGAYGLISSVSQATAVTIAGKANSGMANSTYYAGIDLGMFIGPLVGGMVYGGLPATWFYPVLGASLPAAWIIYAIWRTRNPHALQRW